MKFLFNIIRLLIIAAMIPVSAAYSMQPADDYKSSQEVVKEEVHSGHFTSIEEMGCKHNTEDVPCSGFCPAPCTAPCAAPVISLNILPNILPITRRVEVPKKMSIPTAVFPPLFHPEVAIRPPAFG